MPTSSLSIPASSRPKVTVLMAVYNAEATLTTALDSLLGQTMTAWQAVCIDDASADGSLKILQRYAQRDTRFSVIALSSNSGQAHARNIGLKKAQGGLVTFLDSDDWLSPDALQNVVDTFEKHPQTDTVLFRVVNVYGDREESYPLPSFDRLTSLQAFRLSLDWSIHGVYAARRPLYDCYPYDETCRTYSDDLTTHLHYYLSREVRACSGTYYYRQHEQSATHQPSVRRFDFLRAKERMREYLMELGVDDDTLNGYEEVRWRVLVDCCMFYHVHGHRLTREERQQGLAMLHHAWATIDRDVLPSALTRKFGYRPLSSWTLFRLQEWAYFTLRGWLGKNV